MVDTVEEKLAAASQRLARGKDKYERLARILIGVKAGIDHLTEKLSSLRSGEAHPVLGTLSSIVVRALRQLSCGRCGCTWYDVFWASLLFSGSVGCLALKLVFMTVWMVTLLHFIFFPCSCFAGVTLLPLLDSSAATVYLCGRG